MKHMTGWGWYWLIWIVLGFGVPETIALFRNRDNTLSDTVWQWFGVTDGVPFWHWTFLHFVLLLFMVWLFGHFVFGLWR